MEGNLQVYGEYNNKLLENFHFELRHHQHLNDSRFYMKIIIQICDDKVVNIRNQLVLKLKQFWIIFRGFIQRTSVQIKIYTLILVFSSIFHRFYCSIVWIDMLCYKWILLKILSLSIRTMNNNTLWIGSKEYPLMRSVRAEFSWHIWDRFIRIGIGNIRWIEIFSKECLNEIFITNIKWFYTGNNFFVDWFTDWLLLMIDIQN